MKFKNPKDKEKMPKGLSVDKTKQQKISLLNRNEKQNGIRFITCTTSWKLAK